MTTQSFENGNRGDYRRITGALSLSALLLFGQSAPLLANPTGGAVVAGSATIGAAGKTLSINQSSNNAIINWQTFSIASGETTRFFVPSSTSTTLNMVAAGNPSAIFGTLSSNGRLFLINPSGILVGSTGRIDTAGFLGSTLNPNGGGSGTITFSGNSTASIKNLGSISASSGDVYLIANEVTNKGSITALQGDVGLAAGSSVLLQQSGDQHLFVQAGPTTKRAVGVKNSGSIQAATAELKAAGGNAYALAINNTGSIAATGYKKVNGQIYLTADTGVISNSGSIRATGSSHGGTVHIASQTGTIDNSGVIDVSATAAGGVGGSVSLKSAQGLVSNTGVINAMGGTGGAGGDVDASGGTVDVSSGVVNTLAAGGQTGMFTIDPATWTVAATGGDETGADVATQLATSSIDITATNAITINDSIAWTSGTTLTLTTTSLSGSTIAINAPISGGGLTIHTGSSSDLITTSNAGSINVAAFILQNGTWQQIVGDNGLTALPAFTASVDFELQSSTINNTTSTFERFAGGDGLVTPFQVTDVYGLQGIGSPSGALLSFQYVQNNDIDASNTFGWNGGAGFTPIGNTTLDFSGTYNGQNFAINGLTVNLPAGNAGLFGQIDSLGTVEEVNLNADNITGNNAGGIAAINLGFVESSSAGANGGSVSGASTSTDVGGLVGLNEGVVFESSSAGTVNGGGNSGADGGLVGSNPGGIELSFSSASVTGSNDVGGLVGFNFQTGLIDDSFSSGPVNGTISAGGIAGFNNGTIETSYTTSAVGGSGDVGGLVGKNGSDGVVIASYWANNAGSNGDLSTFGLNNGSSDSFTSGQTLAALANQSTFQPVGEGPGEWDFPATWTTNGNTTTPQLVFSSTNTNPGGGGTPPINLIEQASLDDGSGSNLVPVSTVPQNPDVNSSDTDQPGNDGTFGNTDQSGNGDGGLANSSGNGGLIGPGDSGMLGVGTLSNFSNPAVYSTFGNALGAQVYVSLSDALGLGNGGYYPGDASGKDQTTVDAGDVIVIKGGTIENVAPNQVPGPLKNALGNGAFNSMPGH